MKIDFGKLTAEETKEIATEAMNHLTFLDLMEVIQTVVKDHNRDEVIAQLEQED